MCDFGSPYAQKGYKLYDLDSHKVVLSRDVNFHEHTFPFQKDNASLPKPNSYPLVNPAVVDLVFSSLISSTYIPPLSEPMTSANNPFTPTSNQDVFYILSSNSFLFLILHIHLLFLSLLHLWFLLENLVELLISHSNFKIFYFRITF